MKKLEYRLRQLWAEKNEDLGINFIKESSDLLERIFSFTEQTVLLATADGNIVYANDFFYELTGYEVNDIIGLHTRELNIWDDFQDFKAIAKAMDNQNSISSYIMDILTKSGNKVRCSLSAETVDFGGSKYILSVTKNIDELMRAIQDLEKKRDDYLQMVEQLVDGYFEVDLEGNIIYWNSSLRRILGYPEEGLKWLNNREFTDQENSKKMFNVFNSVYLTGLPMLEEFSIITYQNTEKYVEISTSLINDNNNPTGFRGIVRDITEKKALEDRINWIQKMEAISNLASGVGHNINNLLQVLSGNLTIARMRIDNSSEVVKYMDNCEQAVSSITQIVNQLLEINKQNGFELRSINIHDILSKSLSFFKLTKKQITFEENYFIGNCLCDVDPDNLGQVFHNILINAWHALKNDEKKIYISTEKRSLDKKYVKPYGLKAGEYVKISIRDTGIGMDEVTRKKAFDPFYTTKENGTGLGLFTVYNTILKHGGFLELYSKPDEGTKFDIYLPLSEQNLESIENKNTKIRYGNETVLLVDDEDMVLETTEQLLEAIGYRVFSYNNGREAITHFQNDPGLYNLSIIDMVMPGMDGEQLAVELRKRDPNSRIIMITGYGENGGISRIIGDKCDAILKKPFTLEELSEKLRYTLDR